MLPRIYLIFLLFLVWGNPSGAQIDFRVTSAVGKMSLMPQSELNMNTEPENYLTVGLQADYYITGIFGIGIGADYYLQNPQFNVVLAGYENSYQDMDYWDVDPVARKYNFTVKSNAPEIVEHNTISFIDIPVSVIYSIPVFYDIHLAARFGVKLGWPVNSSYVLSESDLYTRLYFDEWDLELFDIPAHGLYDSRTDWHPDGELSLNKVVSVFYELGLDIPVSAFKVRVSGYFSYGLNDMIDRKQHSLIYWREHYNPVLSLADRVGMMQTGIKVGVGIITKKDIKTKYRGRIKCAWEY